MKKKHVVIIMAMVTFIFVGGVAACKHGHHPGGFDEFDLAAVTNRIASRLDLTESQKADLDQMAREFAERVQAMHAEQENRRQELADLVRQESIDKVLVDQRIAEKLYKMSEMADFAADRLIAFHSTLTPEQREKIAVHIESRASGGCRFGFR
jgi:Spy/CpxP family protein refolding chaperone